MRAFSVAARCTLPRHHHPHRQHNNGRKIISSIQTTQPLIGRAGRTIFRPQARTNTTIATQQSAGRRLVFQGTSRLQNTGNAVVEEVVPHPTKLQLRRVAIEAAVPFIGFGFIDNAILLIAGDMIDLHLGTALGISTMAAAAFGNLISDVMGVGLGGVIERMAQKLGLPYAGLSRAQEMLRVTKITSNIGCAIGVTIGCLLGMFPLLFLETRKPCLEGENDELKARGRTNQGVVDEGRIDGMFMAIGSELPQILECETATLFMVDREVEELWTEDKNDELRTPLRTSIRQGVEGLCASTGQIVNVRGRPIRNGKCNGKCNGECNAESSEEGSASRGKLRKWTSADGLSSRLLQAHRQFMQTDRGIVAPSSWSSSPPDLTMLDVATDARSVLCVPVFNIDGDTVGVLRLRNKNSKEDASCLDVDRAGVDKAGSASREVNNKSNSDTSNSDNDRVESDETGTCTEHVAPLEEGFTDADERVLVTMAAHVSVAIVRAGTSSGPVQSAENSARELSTALRLSAHHDAHFEALKQLRCETLITPQTDTSEVVKTAMSDADIVLRVGIE